MKGYRTMFINAAVAGATAAVAMIDPSVLAEVLGSKWGWLVIPGINIVNMVLRGATNTPVGKAE